jgi:hypothetical protein
MEAQRQGKLSVSNGGISIDGDGNGNWVGIGEYNQLLAFSAYAEASINPQMVLNDSGYLGIGILAPNYRITLGNVANVSGRGIANLWATYSDDRVKTEQKELSYGLDALLQLTPKSYQHHSSEFVDGKLVLGDSKKMIGLIAQEVHKVIPEAALPPEDERVNLWGLDYDRLVPVAINAIKEQNTLITENSNNLMTKATATSLSQLQDLVDTELAQIDSLITTSQQDILTLQEGANTQADLLANIRKEIDLINEQQSALTSLVSAHSDTIIAINENILFSVDSDDNTIATFRGVIAVDRIEAGEIVSERFITAIDEDAPTVGTTIICEEGNTLKDGECESAQDGDEHINGKSVFVETGAITEKSRVMITPKEPISIGVVDIIDGEGFELQVDATVEKEVEVDWFIVEVQ